MSNVLRLFLCRPNQGANVGVTEKKSCSKNRSRAFTTVLLSADLQVTGIEFTGNL